MPDSWPIGSRIVLLDETVSQLVLTPALRTLSQTYRVGPASRALDDSSYIEEGIAFSGVGLRPYAPCHLKREAVVGGDQISWTRRTRIGGDSWVSSSVPVGEEAESYILRVRVAGQIVRVVELSLPEWVYSTDDMVVDGISDGYEVEVSQVSAEYGEGGVATLIVVS